MKGNLHKCNTKVCKTETYLDTLLVRRLQISILLCEPLYISLQGILDASFSVLHDLCIPEGSIDTLKLPGLKPCGDSVRMAGR